MWCVPRPVANYGAINLSSVPSRGLRSFRRVVGAGHVTKTQPDSDLQAPVHKDPSISPESWEKVLQRGELKAKHMLFGPFNRKVWQPYLYDRSLETAQVNKYIYNLKRPSKWTDIWRVQMEEKKVRRKLPVPISLTGIGFDDGNSIKYWRQRIKTTLERLESEMELESGSVVEEMSPVAKIALEHMPEKFTGELALVKQNYEKELTERKQQTTDEDDSFSFPYALSMQIRDRLMQELKQAREEETSVEYAEETRTELLEQEEKQYKSHYDLLCNVEKKMASSVVVNAGLPPEEVEGEMMAWRELYWRRSYGSANPSISPSRVPCHGCGAFLHCNDPGLPGYIPSELFISLVDKKSMKQQLCQRCEFLDNYDVALDVTVDTSEYGKILDRIKHSTAAVILMLDLMDYPCCFWPHLPEIIGKERNLYVVANKVDLLPKDQPEYLQHIYSRLNESLRQQGIIKFRYLSLISAKSGYGVEELITRIASDYYSDAREIPLTDIYLVGTTNVGKSSLFNLLLQSDLCALREDDLIQRATTSIWPGTTLRLLKFPIRKFRGYEIERRKARMNFETTFKLTETKLRNSLYKVTGQYSPPQIVDRVNSTFRKETAFSEEKKPKLPFNEHDPEFANAKYFWDTPGTVLEDQLLTHLTTQELIKTLPRKIITPRTFSLQPLQSLFIGGLARIDVVSARQVVYLTVFASEQLPIHVVYTKQASRFYQFYLGSDMLAVPKGNEERLAHWPPLLPRQMTVAGKSWTESGADLVLSSAGWVSVTIGRDEECILKAYTPNGKGIHLRNPSFLPFAVNMRGRRIPGTPVFEAQIVTIEDNLSEPAKKFFQRMKERSSDNFQAYQAFKSREYKEE